MIGIKSRKMSSNVLVSKSDKRVYVRQLHIQKVCSCMCEHCMVNERLTYRYIRKFFKIDTANADAIRG